MSNLNGAGIPVAARNYAEGIGSAVADRSINRMITTMASKRRETWEEVAHRVAKGNASLAYDAGSEFERMNHHLRQASLLMSGRHLQHGDENQHQRPMEVFTNCSTSAASFLLFYKLLNGSGVGRAYDDALMLVDWSKMPTVVCVIDQGHPDCLSGEIVAPDLRTARHLYGRLGKSMKIITVPDSREGWAKAIEAIETGAFRKDEDTTLVLDFSNVRARGLPIGGMQDRPASGPAPIMSAIGQIARLKGVQMPNWRSTMFVDHYLAECVLVGGARRAARMSTKDWRDPGAIEFAKIKRPIEFNGLEGVEIEKCKAENPFLGSFLWTSNNSITVDAEFWAFVKGRKDVTSYSADLPMQKQAIELMKVILECSYYDGTGEPGLINQDKLTAKGKIVERFGHKFAQSDRLKMDEETLEYTNKLVSTFNGMRYQYIVNPCGEIVLSKLGGYCVIADVVPYHASSDDDAEDAFRTATRALIRTNTMNSIYSEEVNRTNRIGVGMTGLHEYAFNRFGLVWADLVNEESSKEFWLMLSRFKRAVVDESRVYSKKLGMVEPHTNTTIKPAGTTSKLFGLSEGVHLPSMREYLRWVQFRTGDPLIEEYRAMNYPVRDLKVYKGHTIVGFPTQPEICKLGLGDNLVTAGEATPEDQYQWLRLLEKYWIRGVEEDGVTPLEESGNQVSYTLKYDPELVDFERFSDTLIEGQSSVRCCSVMPQTDASSYEYQPEESMTKHDFDVLSEEIIRALNGKEMEEEVDFAHIDCGSGACPIDFKERA